MDDSGRNYMKDLLHELDRIATALEKLAEDPKEEKGPRIDGFGTR